MKRLHKTALILVAIMTAMISGCGADMDRAPTVFINGYGELTIVANDYDGNIKFKDINDRENFYKQFNNLVVKSITMTGRRECKLGKTIEVNNNFRRESLKTKILNIEDCPPKDILTFSYIIKLKTNYGTFTYDFSDKSTFIGVNSGYKPIK